jgi:hypothetical protein
MTKPTPISIEQLRTVAGGDGVGPIVPASEAEGLAWKRINEANRPWRSLPWPGSR